MITRAKALLIIVGNHDALSTDGNWKMLINYISKNGGLLKKGKKLHARV